MMPSNKHRDYTANKLRNRVKSQNWQDSVDRRLAQPIVPRPKPVRVLTYREVADRLKARSVAGLLAALVLLTACDSRPTRVTLGTADAAVAALTFVKDPRTGFCFAVLQSNSNADYRAAALTITWVPCNDQVPQDLKR